MTTGYKPEASGSILGSERDIKLHNWTIAECNTDDSAALMSFSETKMNELFVQANPAVRSKIISGELAPYGSMTSEEFLTLELLQSNPDANSLYKSYIIQEVQMLFDADSDLFNAGPVSVNDTPVELTLP